MNIATTKLTNCFDFASGQQNEETTIAVHVVNEIQDLGCQVEHIPGGCTGLCQPVDIGINKPFKDRVYNSWEAFLMQQDMRLQWLDSPSCKNLSNWIVSAVNDIPPSIVKKAWRRAGFSYFPLEESEGNAKDGDGWVKCRQIIQIQ